MSHNPESHHSNEHRQHDAEYERLNHEAFAVAFDQYLHKFRDGDELRARQGKRDGPKDPEREAREAMDSMRDHYAMLESVGTFENGPAGMTVTIPVAVNGEDFANVTKSIELLQKAQAHLGEPINIVIWANSFYKRKGQKADVTEQSERNFERLRTELESYSNDDIRIFAGLSVNKGDVNMTNMRVQYMEATAMLSAEQGNGFMHPVMWLDADTTSMRYNTLSAVRDEVQKGEVLFPHPKLHYDIDWLPEGQLLSDADNATKAVAADEIYRRLAYRGKERLDYPEESGFCMAIGTYLSIGGLHPILRNMTLPRISESHSMVARAEYVASMRGKLAGKELREESLGWNIIPEGLVQSDQPTKVTDGFIEKTSMGTSARRMYKRVREEGASALLAYGTQLATQLSGEKKARDVNSSDMYWLVNNERHYRPGIDGKRYRIAVKTIKRYFE